jgi:hypothetical protein
VAQVWRRAVAKGAPDPALADIALTTKGGQRTWSFVVEDRSQGEHTTAPPIFQTAFADDCG